MASLSISSRKLSESSSFSSSSLSSTTHLPFFSTSLHNSPSSSPPQLPITAPLELQPNPSHAQSPPNYRCPSSTAAATTLTKVNSSSPSEVDPKPLPPPPARSLDVGRQYTAVKTSPRSICAGEPRRSSFKLQYRHPKSDDDPFLLAIQACSKDNDNDSSSSSSNNNNKEKEEWKKDDSDEDNDNNNDDDGRHRDLGSKLVSKLIVHRRNLPYLCSYTLIHESHLPTRVMVVSSSSSSSSSSPRGIGDAKSSSSAVSATGFPVVPTTNIHKACKALEDERNHGFTGQVEDEQNHGCTGQLEGVDLPNRRLPMIPRKSHGRIAREALDLPEPTFVAPKLTNKTRFNAECMKRTRAGHPTRRTTTWSSSSSSSASSSSKETRPSSHVRECSPVSVSCGKSNYNSRAIARLIISPVKRRQSVANWIGCKSTNAVLDHVLLPTPHSMSASSPAYSVSGQNTFKA